jgi:hypothetical protein
MNTGDIVDFTPHYLDNSNRYLVIDDKLHYIGNYNYYLSVIEISKFTKNPIIITSIFQGEV